MVNLSWIILVLLSIKLLEIVNASIDYVDSAFAIDFNSDTGVDMNTNVVVGSFCSYGKDVKVYFDVTKDPSCKYMAPLVYLYYADCASSSCLKTQFFASGGMSSNFTTSASFSKSMSSVIAMKVFSVNAVGCAYNVKAYSVST